MTTMSAAQVEARRKGGRVLHSPEMLAKRLAKSWADLDDQQRDDIAAALGPLVLLRGKTLVDLVAENQQQLSNHDVDRLLDVALDWRVPGDG